MRPFFCYYGGKWRSAPRYPAPRHGLIVEPFAGAAGYATRHHSRRVMLVDADETIAGLWAYLIAVRASEIRSLPIDVDHIDSLNVAEEARWLIGFWLNKGASSPRKRPSAWMRAGRHVNSFWGASVRDRIAWQVEQIRHWSVVNGSYAWDVANHEATWFIDPPYVNAGRHYRCANVDYSHLAGWCRTRNGQVIVCENEGADWLPFQPLGAVKATSGRKRSGYSAEAVWLGDVQAASEAA